MIPLFVLLALAGGGLAGCAPSPEAAYTAEIEDPDYKRAKELLRMGREREAMALFLRIIDQRSGAAAESHLEVAILYHKHIKDPISAIYHYRRFVELRKGGEQARLVEQSIQACVRDFARTLPAQPLDNQIERTDLLDTVDRLQRENLQLKEQLAATRAALVDASPAQAQTAPPLEPSQGFVPDGAASAGAKRREAEPEYSVPVGVVPVPSPAPQPVAVPAAVEAAPVAPPAPPPAASGRKHVVAKGDTLMNISLRHYGTRTRWKEIYAANRDQLPTETALKIGMELRIP